MRRFREGILILILLTVFLTSVYAETKQVSVTFDDLPAVLVRTHSEQLSINQRILDVLDRYGVKATGFVIGCKLYGKNDILELWLERGHDLGNHTYSHMDFDQVDPPAFELDIKKGAFKIEKLLADHNKSLTYFRFPYLHTGNSQEKREEIKKFLEENCYITAPVTIDPHDWEFNEVFVKAWGSNDKGEQGLIKTSYLETVKHATEEEEKLCWERFGRNIKHVLLLHLNRLNADMLDQVLEYYSQSGYSFISLEEALTDSVYSLEAEYAGSEGSAWPIILK